MSRADPPTSNHSIDSLLRSGLDHYGRNEVKEAIAHWRQVLRLDPTNEQALDFLQTAGALSEKPDAQVLPFSREPSSRVAPESLVPSEVSSSSKLLSIAPEEPAQLITPEGELADPELKNLLKERRFEDALQRLYALRSKRPRDEGLSRSIQLLREKLADVYSDQLVHLDRVPRLTPSAERHAFSSDERHVAGLIDGISSFGDIAHASKLGRVPTLRILCQLQQAHLLTSSSSSIAAPRRVGPGVGSSAAVPTPAPSPAPAYHPPAQAKAAEAYRPSGGSRSPAPSYSQTPRDLVPPAFEDAQAPFVPSVKSGAARTSDTVPKSSEHARSAQAEAASAYEARFAQATHYYLVRDFDRAIELFRQCEAERPDDPRPRHNLKAIQNRTGKS